MVNLTYRASPALHKARAARRWRARSATSAISRRPTCRAGSSASIGATGAPRTAGCGGCRRSTASKGTVGDIGIHIVDFATFARGSDIVSLSSRRQDLPQGRGRPDRQIQARCQQLASSCRRSSPTARSGRSRRPASRPATPTKSACRSSATRAGSWCTPTARKSSLQMCAGGDIDKPEMAQGGYARRCRPPISVSPGAPAAERRPELSSRRRHPARPRSLSRGRRKGCRNQNDSAD